MMVDSKLLCDHLRSFAFRDAFHTLAWNHPTHAPFTLEAQGRECLFTPIAEAGGFVVLEVTEPEPPEKALGLTRPGSQSLRRALAERVTRTHRAHILLFVDAERQDSVWQCSPIPGRDQHPAARRFTHESPVAPLVALLRKLEIPFE
ncbi:MAG TPA: hypothetical protein VHR86_03230, partial [Armatimonadota bacterium]|nr:hypothetical protein [Armatimonadota bacterium]